MSGARTIASRAVVVGVIALGACAAACDGSVAVVLERLPVCLDPGDESTCSVPTLPEDGDRELVVFRAEAGDARCDERIGARAAGGGDGTDRVISQVFRGDRGSSVGELADGRYTFVALVRSAAAACAAVWWGCTDVALDGDEREIEIELRESSETVRAVGCGEGRACRAEIGSCE